MPGERVLAEDIAGERHQAIRSFATVDGLRRHEEPNARRETQHMPAFSSTSINRASILVSNEVGMRSTCPDAKESSKDVAAGASSTGVGRTASSWNVVGSAWPSRRRHR